MFQRLRGFTPLSGKKEGDTKRFDFVSRLTMLPSHSQEAIDAFVQVRPFQFRTQVLTDVSSAPETSPPNQDPTKR